MSSRLRGTRSASPEPRSSQPSRRTGCASEQSRASIRSGEQELRRELCCQEREENQGMQDNQLGTNDSASVKSKRPDAQMGKQLLPDGCHFKCNDNQSIGVEIGELTQKEPSWRSPFRKTLHRRRLAEQPISCRAGRWARRFPTPKSSVSLIVVAVFIMPGKTGRRPRPCGGVRTTAAARRASSSPS